MTTYFLFFVFLGREKATAKKKGSLHNSCIKISGTVSEIFNNSLFL